MALDLHYKEKRKQSRVVCKGNERVRAGCSFFNESRLHTSLVFWAYFPALIAGIRPIISAALPVLLSTAGNPPSVCVGQCFHLIMVLCRGRSNQGLTAVCEG